VRIAPLSSAEADARLGHLAAEERFEQAWFAAGERLFAGHLAVWEGVYRVPGGWLLRPLRWLPGFNFVSDRVYRWVAAHRPRSCRTGGKPL
jgi:predicted DCC family thiol-disulfide oxidoreductase YuxK